MVSTTLNTTGEYEHVRVVERQIQVIKECILAHHANLPFPSFTRRMTIELTKHIVMFLRAFPPKNGLSKTYSLRIIMTGKALDWKKSCKLHFGAYTQVQENRNMTNTIEERTQGAIRLGSTVNLQGTYNLFSIQYGEKITHGQFT